MSLQVGSSLRRLGWHVSRDEAAEFELSLSGPLNYFCEEAVGATLQMERVEFQQEQMLGELKDMEEKGLFSKVRQTFVTNGMGGSQECRENSKLL